MFQCQGPSTPLEKQLPPSQPRQGQTADEPHLAAPELAEDLEIGHSHEAQGGQVGDNEEAAVVDLGVEFIYRSQDTRVKFTLGVPVCLSNATLSQHEPKQDLERTEFT